jgi:16S rRNA (cytosine1402-N4)-methyltransferase
MINKFYEDFVNKETINKPTRRPRYGGTHPRHFKEKYKELNPKRYPEEIQKVTEGGKTPAGTHRAICIKEILKTLDPKAGDIVLDATLGYGGHSLEILNRISPGGRLVGFDLDSVEILKTEARIRAAGFSQNIFTSCHSNYSEIPEKLLTLGVGKVQCVLADLGMSSMQIDNPERGFSFKVSGPLDMQLDPNGTNSAALFLKTVTERVLIKILEKNADEVFAPEIAKAIVNNRRRKPILTTDDLVEVIRMGLRSLPRRLQKDLDDKPIRRVFQALRIAVNEEFRALDLFLENLPRVLASGGKAAILTFHSGEDRRVKKAFQLGHRTGLYSDVAREVIRPSREEIYSNPRATAAKLRWAIRR